MSDDFTPEQARELEAQLDAEFPIEGMRLDISTLWFQLANRTKERDDARAIVARIRELHCKDTRRGYQDYCEYCEGFWPCATVRALDGTA